MYYRIFIALLVTILPACAFAQTNAKTDTTYLNRRFAKTDKNNAIYYRIAQQDNSGGYFVKDYNVFTNQLRMSGHFDSLKSEYKGGYFKYYTENGNAIEEGSYLGNRKNGEWKMYYDHSDSLHAVVHYENDTLRGDLISYYKDGKVKRRETDTRDTAYGKCYDEQGNEITFTRFMIPATPTYNLSEFITDHLRYPFVAKMQGIEGKVTISFDITEDGGIDNAVVIKGAPGGCNEEALNVIKVLPPWRPEIVDGIPTRSTYTHSIVFRLE